MRNQPKPQEIYRHFKGGLYRIVTLAAHTETKETLVVYQALYGDNSVFAREISMFLSETDTEKYPDAVQKYRFELQQELITPQNIQLPVKEETAEVQEKMESVKEIEAVKETKPAEETELLKKSEPVEEIESLEEVGTPEEKVVQEKAEEVKESGIDPVIMRFLDAETYMDRLNILTSIHHKITDDLINTMAAALDVEVREGDIEERYVQLRSCLLTLEKYECNRLR